LESWGGAMAPLAPLKSAYGSAAPVNSCPRTKLEGGNKQPTAASLLLLSKFRVSTTITYTLYTARDANDE